MIEDIQKVNKLAQELLDQEIAIDREDAVKKAQEMLNKNIENDNKPKPNQLTNERSLQKDNARIEIAKCMDLINKTREQMSKQIDTFSQKMNEIIKEINNIQEKLKSKSASEITSESEKPLKEAVKEPKEESRLEKQEQLEKQEPHPKRGNTTSEDVSIEKMFYYGNK